MHSLRSVCVLAAVGCHALVLFGIRLPPPQPAPVPPEPERTYIDVGLEEAPPAGIASEPVSVPSVAPSGVEPVSVLPPEPPPQPVVQAPLPEPAPELPPEPVAEAKPEPAAPAPKAGDFVVAGEPGSAAPVPTHPQSNVKAPPITDTAIAQASGTSVPGSGTPLAQAGDALASSEYRHVLQPHYLKHGQAVYPRQSRRLRQEGVVMLRLFINELGGLDRVEISRSSGFPLLDEAAVAAERASRFRPAYVGNRPVPSQAEVPYRFQLPR